jgi:hypothetical protein
MLRFAQDLFAVKVALGGGISRPVLSLNLVNRTWRGPDDPVASLPASCSASRILIAGLSAVALSGRAFELLERHGARNCRLFAQQPNGIQPEVLISSIEFDSFKACAKTPDLMTSDPEGRSIIELAQSPDSPTRTLSTDIYTEIPT